MKLNPDFKLETVAGENMLVRTSGGKVDMTSVFSINEPAAWLWNAVKDIQFDEKKLVELLTGEYDVSAEVAAVDVHDLLDLFDNYGMLIR